MLYPVIKFEDTEMEFFYENNFLPDFKGRHPRLSNCLGVYILNDEEDEWSISNDGKLHHANHSTTHNYCIEVLKVITYKIETK